MSVADDLYQYATDSGMFADYRLQVGKMFGGENQQEKFCVIKPMSSGPVRLIRQQQYSIYIVGPVDSSGYEEIALAESFTDYIAANYQFQSIESMTPSVGGLVFSAENRPIIEIGLNILVSL